MAAFLSRPTAFILFCLTAASSSASASIWTCSSNVLKAESIRLLDRWWGDMVLTPWLSFAAHAGEVQGLEGSCSSTTLVLARRGVGRTEEPSPRASATPLHASSTAPRLSLASIRAWTSWASSCRSSFMLALETVM